MTPKRGLCLRLSLSWHDVRRTFDVVIERLPEYRAGRYLHDRPATYPPHLGRLGCGAKKDRVIDDGAPHRSANPGTVAALGLQQEILRVGERQHRIGRL